MPGNSPQSPREGSVLGPTTAPVAKRSPGDAETAEQRGVCLLGFHRHIIRLVIGSKMGYTPNLMVSSHLGMSENVVYPQ